MTDVPTPILTIAIPTCNRASYLTRLLADIAAISLPSDCEILILDNASTDQTATLLESQKDIPGLRVVRNKHNVGIEGNIINAMLMASGQFVWLLSDHMRLDAVGVTNLFTQLRRHNSISVGYAGIREYGSFIRPGHPQPLHQLTPEQKARLLFNTSNISGLVIRAELIRKAIRSIYRASGYTFPHLGIYFHLHADDQIVEFPTCSSFQTTDRSNYAISYDTFRSRFIEFPQLLRKLQQSNSALPVARCQTGISEYRSAMSTEIVKRFQSPDGVIDWSTLIDCLPIYRIGYGLLFMLLWLTGKLPLALRTQCTKLFLRAFCPARLDLAKAADV